MSGSSLRTAQPTSPGWELVLMKFLVLCSDFLISCFVRYASPTPKSGVICQDTDSAGGGGDDDMGGAHVSGAHHRQRMTLSRPAGTAGRCIWASGQASSGSLRRRLRGRPSRGTSELEEELGIWEVPFSSLPLFPSLSLSSLRPCPPLRPFLPTRPPPLRSP